MTLFLCVNSAARGASADLCAGGLDVDGQRSPGPAALMPHSPLKLLFPHHMPMFAITLLLKSLKATSWAS